ncbi:hypothetical protein CROQUDRAFT_377041 [Cronartium quercuum f. sp. fusiforme G11]|uniref:Uncharacterized protein n=1 Tax=Cronartium quercuum f. sp. fusiforme G11 TaxID=708437 RepID=A0A9P6NKN3_9BASI|nr:hypothetical protein CROQUDRAFT_377041 [Cronartium quercuum f. sp. fusiforme G11]
MSLLRVKLFGTPRSQNRFERVSSWILLEKGWVKVIKSFFFFFFFFFFLYILIDLRSTSLCKPPLNHTVLAYVTKHSDR